uniref:Uncharacterized protein n=1 Tax=Branchiostoma floridae TaxID=7739 RepID=C3YHA6_BRAFL|eukprot:XP_002604331.1 hypothetical protein BRAFLDRAFT_88621 [Branchiostoma floridae]
MHIVPITVTAILLGLLLTAVFRCMKEGATRNTAGAAVHIELQAMTVRNPVNAMVDAEEEANTNASFPQSLQCDEAQTVAEATGTSQGRTEPVTSGATHTAEAEIHIYNNDDTHTYRDDDA